MIADLKSYAEHKDSELTWLERVPRHWDVRKPRHIGTLLKGVGGTKEDAVADGVPCVRYGELYTTHTFFVRKPKAFIHPDRASNYTPIHYGDVLFAASGETLEEIGKSAVNLIEGTAVCGGDVIILRPNVPVYAGFLGYVMDCRPSAIQKAAMGRGTTVKHIYPDELKNLLFPFPPVPEQAAIVRFLDWANGRLERAIRAKRKVIALLNEQKQAIIHRAVTRGLDPSVPLKPSGILSVGEIPEHWEVRRLKSLVKESVAGPYGSSLTKAMYTQAGMRVYGQQQVIPDDFELGDYFVSLEKFEEMKRYQVFPGDVLVSVMGTVGKVAVVPDAVQPGIINPRLVRYRPDFAAVRARWLQLAIQDVSVRHQLLEASKGTTMDGLNLGILGRLWLVVPPLAEQDAILKNVASEREPLIAAICRKEREIELLRELRTRLVSDVVTGKLDVREAAARLRDEPSRDGAEDAADQEDDLASEVQDVVA